MKWPNSPPVAGVGTMAAAGIGGGGGGGGGGGEYRGGGSQPNPWPVGPRDNYTPSPPIVIGKRVHPPNTLLSESGGPPPPLPPKPSEVPILYQSKPPANPPIQ